MLVLKAELNDFLKCAKLGSSVFYKLMEMEARMLIFLNREITN